jgi:AraC family transcriptional regulator of adaptative response / DNA-3-methyladenine glycosylase II
VTRFGAVRTTGIYCRPGCGGRPNAENLSSFPLPAAAEAAGFRACFQCRPYRWPQTISWTGPELVCRAVRLVVDGALDGSREEELGARLGISSRHLRRLFVSHLGVTPAALARSARAHHARRLLDDTDLSVLEIALASGFGSVRQCNRACKEIFRATPRALRARRRRSDRLVADGGLPLRLTFLGELDWETLARYLATRAIPGVEAVQAGTYRRTIWVDGSPGVLELSRGGDDHLLCVMHLPHWAQLTHLVARARRIGSLDLDLCEPAEHLARDPTIGPLLRRRPGLRPPGAWDQFEIGVRAIVGQQISVSAASTIVGRIVQRAGQEVPGLAPFGLTHVFPDPETLLAADLGGLGLTSSRREAVREFARAVLEGTVRLDQSVGLDALVGTLTSLPGLGPWTAQYIALRIGEPDAFPASDLGLRRALARGGVASAGEVEALAESWRPWRALAATHLWMSAGVRTARDVGERRAA